MSPNPQPNNSHPPGLVRLDPDATRRQSRSADFKEHDVPDSLQTLVRQAYPVASTAEEAIEEIHLFYNLKRYLDGPASADVFLQRKWDEYKTIVQKPQSSTRSFQLLIAVVSGVSGSLLTILFGNTPLPL